MSEENNINTHHEESDQHTYTTKSPDTMMHDFVTWANKGIGQGITLSVKGKIYTGQLISGADWCDLQIQAQSHAGGTAGQETITAMTSYYESIKKSYYSSEAIADKENSGEAFHYLHMKDARIWDGVNLSEIAMHWRFKIGEVDGFSIGSLSKKS